MEIDKLKKTIYSNKNVSVDHLKQLSTKLTEETTNTSVVGDLPKLLPVVFSYAVHQEKGYREAALPALTELAGLLDLNKHLKEKPWWKEMKGDILKSVDVLMNLVSTGDGLWAKLWKTIVMMLGSDLRSELTLLNRLLKVVEKAFKMNDEEVRHQGFECWCKLIDNFSINKNEINNKRKLALLVIPLKANNHNTPRLCASKMKTWKHLLSKLDQHNEMTVQTLVSHFLEFMFCGVGSVPPACKTLGAECANIFAQMLQTPLLYRILPKLFIKYAFVCIEHVHRDLPLSLSVWEGLLSNMKSNGWADDHVSELMTHLCNASKSDKLGKSKTFAHLMKSLYLGSHALPNGMLIQNLKIILSLALEPQVLSNFKEEWCHEILNIVGETDPIQLPQDILGDITRKLNVLANSELFRDEKLKFLRGMWMNMTNIICKWMSVDGQIGKNKNEDSDLYNIHQLLLFGAAPLSSTWNKLQMKSWRSLYSECVKYFSLSTEVKCEKFVSDLVELLLEGVKDKKIPLHVALDLVSIILECHLSKDGASILPLMMEVAISTMNSFQNDTTGTLALLNQYLKIILAAARSEPALVSDMLTIADRMLVSLEDTPLISSHLDKTRNAILKTKLQLNNLKPCRSQDRAESPNSSNLPSNTSPSMTSFMHRLAKSKETKSKVGSPTPSQSSDTSSPSHTPKSKKASSPFSDMKSEDFVFVPPKPRKILLTDHQKESLTTRKHDIPALYQDLSQDSSQSAFESIVTPVHVENKEQKIEKEPVIKSPQSFKEVNFGKLSPRKSTGNLNTSASKDKLQNNKENDWAINNKKSPNKLISKETKQSDILEDPPLNLLQEDQKKMSGDTVSKDVETAKEITPKRPRKSLSSDSSNNHSVPGAKENSITSSILHNSDDGIQSDSDDIRNIAFKTEEISTGKTDSDANHDHNTPKNSRSEVTPKRSLRKNKLSISIEKSGMRSKQKGDSGNKNIKGESNVSDGSVKSTPKVSPRRLRKRKSGVTPILGGGDFIKKIRKSQSPVTYRDSPSNNGEARHLIPTKSQNDSISKNGSITVNDECIVIKELLVEKVENESKMKLEKEAGVNKTCSKSETEKNNTTTNRSEDFSKSNTQSEDGKGAVVNLDNEVEVVADLGAQQKDKQRTVIQEGKDTSVKMVVDESKKLPSKNLISLKDNVPCIDISCSPVKVVVERLPVSMVSVMERVMNCERDLNLEETECAGNSAQKSEDKKETTVRTITRSLSASHDLNCNKVDESCKLSNFTNKPVKEKEEKSEILIVVKNTPPEIMLESCNQNKSNDTITVFNKTSDVTPDTEHKPFKTATKENGNIKNDNSLVVNAQVEVLDMSSSHRKTRSQSSVLETTNSEIDSKNVDSSDKVLASEDQEQESTDIEITPVKKGCCLESLQGAQVEVLDVSSSHRKTRSQSSVLETTNSVIDSKNSDSSDKVLASKDQKQESTDIEITPVKKGYCLESLEGAQVEVLDVSSSHRKTRSQSSVLETTNSVIDSKNSDSSDKVLASEDQKQESTDIDITPVKKGCCLESLQGARVSACKSTEPTASPSPSSKPKSNQNTPVKSGQKQLKQTQLPFTPIRKTKESSSNLSSELEPSGGKTESENKLPLVCLVKMGTQEIDEALHSPKLKSGNKQQSEVESEPNQCSHRINEPNHEEISNSKTDAKNLVTDNVLITEQVQRTPEKSKLNAPVLCLQRTEAEVNPSTVSPSSIGESEDIICSSQETDVTTQSMLLTYRNSSMNHSSKLSSKSPKKCENAPQAISSSDRVLRSSPLKTENSRLSGTPAKKSVCRRLDVEIPESPEFSENDGQHNNIEEKSVEKANSEELSNDFKLLNGEGDNNKKSRNDNLPLGKEEELTNDADVNNIVSSDCSPRTNKTLQRFVMQPDISNPVSPKRTMGSLRFDSSSSPISSPNSRTSQMMELAKQESERTVSTISSPAGSAKRRRILPVRVGPVTRTPKSQQIVRRHAGPSEEWVRRTYSPSASPNSSILKRSYGAGAGAHLSPDSSPPSSKKKRVSFLDPPVSESLLFSKANPGKGQIQRPEPKQVPESEELSQICDDAEPSKEMETEDQQEVHHEVVACQDTESEEATQGSLTVDPVAPPTTEPGAVVFAPLQQCPNPLKDILERIVNPQWMSELETQLERLGVTTVGQLSALPEETVQRLPFIPPKLERLRRILQNYYNEINEKPQDTKLMCLEAGPEECLTSGKDEEKVESPEKTICQGEIKSLEKDPKTPDDDLKQTSETSVLKTSFEDFSSMAEQIKNQIEQHPELIRELGHKLHIDVAMEIMTYAVCKLKKDNGMS